jgi:KUP system potassium uptake protein
MMHHIKHNQVLHAQVVLFSIRTLPVPWVGSERRVEVTPLEHGVYRLVATVGFMQSPDVPALLAASSIDCDTATTTYYLGQQTLLTTGKARFAKWRKLLFAFLARNARPASAFFNLPPNRVVELGVQIEL